LRKSPFVSNYPNITVFDPIHKVN